jgi:hypothetical protein
LLSLQACFFLQTHLTQQLIDCDYTYNLETFFLHTEASTHRQHQLANKMAAQQKRMLKAQTSKLGKVDITVSFPLC